MKHLLLNRFQGALIGANLIYIDRQRLIPNQLITEITPSLITGISYLIRPDRFDTNKWTKNIFSDIPSPDRAMVAMLPLMLFFHNDRVKLRDVLIDVSHIWQLDWETYSSAVAIGYIISRSLTESFSARAIIPQLLDEMSNIHPLLFQELSTIDRLLNDSSSLRAIIQQNATISDPIIAATAIAIYCFLSTPEDFSLAIRRANRVGDRSLLTCALTGILAGTQNSLAGIPLNGYMATQDRFGWLLAAENLLNAWAGVYYQQNSSSPMAVLPAISTPMVACPLSVASPQVIQRRN
jgi:ADP-ribosylglycohydrolase